MGDCFLTKYVVAFAAIVGLLLSSLLAQDLPKSDDEPDDLMPCSILYWGLCVVKLRPPRWPAKTLCSSPI